MSKLFTPIQLRGLTLSNRIIVAPMCQYSANNGKATDWHFMHLGQYSISGAGLLIIEMTNVEPEGRITPQCMGLWGDDTEAAIKPLIEFNQRYGNVPMCIQLAHAGRKASTRPPWRGSDRVPLDQGGWLPRGASAIADDNYPPPHALTTGEVKTLVDKFADSAARAARLGFAAIELHAAHGYLLHQFLSPLSNHRKDEYGGTLHNRMRFVLEVFDAVRAQWPQDRPLGVRVSATDWVKGGWDLESTVALARELDRRSCDFIDVSSGGLVRRQSIAPSPGFQVPFAKAIKAQCKMAVMAVGLITKPEQAEQIVADGNADMVALARGMLWDPRWPWHAAHALGVADSVRLPDQYLRCLPPASG